MSVKASAERLKKGRLTLKMESTCPWPAVPAQTSAIHPSDLTTDTVRSCLLLPPPQSLSSSQLPCVIVRCIIWNSEPKQTLPSSCSCQVCRHGNKKTDSDHWPREWGCCCDKPDAVVCRPLELVWKKNVDVCGCGVREYLEYNMQGLKGHSISTLAENLTAFYS